MLQNAHFIYDGPQIGLGFRVYGTCEKLYTGYRPGIVVARASAPSNRVATVPMEFRFGVPVSLSASGRRKCGLGFWGVGGERGLRTLASCSHRMVSTRPSCTCRVTGAMNVQLCV